MVSTCPTCGAPLEAGSWSCAHCGSAVNPALAGIPSLEAAGTLLGQGGADLERALPQLAATLEHALGSAVTVEREHHFLSRSERVLSLAVLVGQYRFVLAREGAGDVIGAYVNFEVNGVALRHDRVAPAVWCQQLGQALRDAIAESGPVAPALRHLLGESR